MRVEIKSWRYAVHRSCFIHFAAPWILGLVFLSSFCFRAQGQTREDVSAMSHLFAARGYNMFRSYRQHGKSVTGILFVAYKNYISSQDGSHCTFYPSCSAYAAQSIRKKGFFIGVLAAFDRLSRCNGWSDDKYPLKKGTHLLYDPVE